MARHKGLTLTQAAERRRAIVARCMEGLQGKAVAAEFGVSENTVTRALAEHGLSGVHKRGIRVPMTWRDIPADKLEPYRFLTVQKNLPAAEARRMLEGDAR